MLSDKIYSKFKAVTGKYLESSSGIPGVCLPIQNQNILPIPDKICWRFLFINYVKVGFLERPFSLKFVRDIINLLGKITKRLYLF